MNPTNNPATQAFALTQEDFDYGTPTKANAAIPKKLRGLYVGTAGTLVLTTSDGKVATFVNVANGTLLPIATKRLAAASTARDVVGLL